MKPETVVRNKITGVKGVVVTDPFGTCSSDEVPVCYEGASDFLGTPIAEIEEIGPENAVIDDPKKCGAGRGAECCIFLVAGKNGFQCQRYGEMRYSLISRKRKMIAQREPTELYPKCQL